MKNKTANIFNVNEEDLIPKRHYSIRDIARAFNDKDRMTTWHFLVVNKVIYTNGFANKQWLNDRLCFSKKNDFGDYDTFFTQEGYNLIMEMWKNKSRKWA